MKKEITVGSLVILRHKNGISRYRIISCKLSGEASLLNIENWTYFSRYDSLEHLLEMNPELELIGEVR